MVAHDNLRDQEDRQMYEFVQTLDHPRVYVQLQCQIIFLFFGRIAI